MNRRIARDLSAAVRRVTGELALWTAESSPHKEVAAATGGLPAYLGWTAALVITPEGDVLEYEYDTGITSVANQNWRTTALTTAARRFHELKDLAPVRPRSAVNCPLCDGHGVLVALLSVGCGTCWGAGWIELPKDRTAAKRLLAEAEEERERLRQLLSGR
jgi:hypothetical protein